MKKPARLARGAAGAILGASCAISAPAQVVIDPNFSNATVGAGEYAPGQTTDYLIRESYGRRAGDNLFHRFDRFDVPSGESATFVEDAPGSGIRHVFAHVGGSSASQVDGVLRSTIPNADLYLYNARGVIFGPEARLDLQGAFHTSSAEQIRFADDVRFGESASGPVVTLSAAEPAAWGFLSASPAGLAVEGGSLAAPDGTRLTLVGGPLRLEGPGTAASTPTLSAPSGRLELIAVGSPGEVAIDPFEVPDVSGFERLAPITLSEGALLDASGTSDSSFVARGDSLSLDDARLVANHTGPNDHPGLAIDIDLRGALRLGDSAAGTTGVFESLALRESAPGGGPGPDVGDGGDVRLAADSLTIDGLGSSLILGTACTAGFSCSAAAQPGGSGGDLIVDVDRFEIQDLGFLALFTAGSGMGSAATIRARTVEVSNDADIPRGTAPGTFLGTFSFGGFMPGATPPPADAAAAAGAIQIVASDLVRIAEGAEIRSITQQNGAGGDLVIDTARFEGVDSQTNFRAGVRTATEVAPGGSPFGAAGLGNAGDITIRATRDISFENAFASSRAIGGAPGATGAIELRAPNGTIELRGRALIDVRNVDGNGSTVSLEARRIALRKGGLVQSTVVGDGAAGDIALRADDILIRGVDASGTRSGLFSKPLSPNAPGAGAGGTIRIDGRRLRVDRGATIELTSLQDGPAGNLIVGGSGALDSMVLDDARVVSETSDVAAAGGRIEIRAGTIALQNGSRLSTANLASGDAGTIELRGRTLRVVGGSEIATTSGRFGPGAGGDVTSRMTGTTLIDRGRISTDARSASPANQGGSIDLASQVLILSSSALGASAPAGAGGNIQIVAGRFVQSPSSTLDASGASPELAGLVRVLSAETNTLRGVRALPVVFPDPTERLATGCEDRTRASGSLYVWPRALEAPPGESLDVPPSRGEPSWPSSSISGCGRTL